MISDRLVELGDDVLSAADGPEGLSILQSIVRADMPITDVGLPGGMKGRKLAGARFDCCSPNSECVHHRIR